MQLLFQFQLELDLAAAESNPDPGYWRSGEMVWDVAVMKSFYNSEILASLNFDTIAFYFRPIIIY